MKNKLPLLRNLEKLVVIMYIDFVFEKPQMRRNGILIEKQNDLLCFTDFTDYTAQVSTKIPLYPDLKHSR